MSNPMKLFHSPSSPFVRKCVVVAMEHGLEERIERIAAAPSVLNRLPELEAANPLGKVPALQAQDGTWLFDSPVICEYLDSLAGGGMLPAQGPARWRVLTLQALADGALDAAVLLRYEQALRPEALRWDQWQAGQRAKIVGAVDMFERSLGDPPGDADKPDLGAIAAGCLLGYLDFRHPDIGWRTDRPALAAWYERFAERASMRATVPVG